MNETNTSRIVYPGADGKLVYVRDERGNRIPDFSHAGYQGGGVNPPHAPVREAVEPGAGDDGARIQAAVDRVSHMPPDRNGFRGAVLLKRGRYQIAGLIWIYASGVVLRGEGQGEDGTVLEATGKQRRPLIVIRPPGNLPRYPEVPGTRRKILDAYVPVGARSFRVEGASGLQIGDAVMIHRPSTQKWISALGMDRIPRRWWTGRKVVQWTPGVVDIRYRRVITSIEANRITVDAPLFHALDREYGQPSIYLYDGRYLIEQVGIEGLRSVSAFSHPKDEAHALAMVYMNYVQNAWLRKVTALHYCHGIVRTDDETQWITVQDGKCLDPVSKIKGGRRYSFYMYGQLHLIQGCYARNGRHDFATETTRSSGIVFLGCTSEKIHAANEPHRRYSTGILYDNIRHLTPKTKLVLGLWNRSNYGSGQGWGSANSVLWNCTAPEGGIACEKPPLAQNYAIGCMSKWMSSNMRWGEKPGLKAVATPGEAHWEHWNSGPVTPQSLYRAQLEERLGGGIKETVLGPQERVNPEERCYQ